MTVVDLLPRACIMQWGLDLMPREHLISWFTNRASAKATTAALRALGVELGPAEKQTGQDPSFILPFTVPLSHPAASLRRRSLIARCGLLVSKGLVARHGASSGRCGPPGC
jgi:hypothetical protein